MKKSIILLVTLLFITAISFFIVKNIDLTDKVIMEGNSNTNLAQLQVSIKNINKEVIDFLNKQDNLSEIFELIPEQLPLSFGDINAHVQMSLFDPSEYYVLDKNITKSINQFDMVYVSDPYSFEEIISEHNITNQQQVDYVIDKYINYVNDDSIMEIKDKFIYKKFPKLNDQNETIDYVKLDYIIHLNNLQSKVHMIINVQNKKEEVKEVSIQRLQ